MEETPKKAVVRKPRALKPVEEGVEVVASRATRVRPAKAAEASLSPEGVVVATEGTYTYAIGRRKESVAQVRYFLGGTGKMTVNGRDYLEYFNRFDLQEALRAPLTTVGKLNTVDIVANVRGGGIRGQAEAIRLGIARALLMQDANFRAPLKVLDFLRRDPRKKERKKYGLKKARRAPQWAKR